MTSQGARGHGYLILPVTLTATLIGAARAQEDGSYRFEAGLHLEFQSDAVLAAFPNVDGSLVDLRAGWYLEEIAPPELGGQPIGERAFLGHVPFIGLRLGSLSTRYLDPLGQQEGNGTIWGFESRVAAQNVPVAGNLFYRSGTLEEDDGDELDVSEFGVRVGYWLQDNLEVGLLYASTKCNHPLLDTGDEAFGAHAKSVREVGIRTMNLEAEITSVRYNYEDVLGGEDTGANLRLAVGCDCYLDENVGIGAALVLSAGDYAEARGFGFEVRTQYNRGSALGLGLAAGHFMTSEEDVDDTTSARISVVYRR